MLPKGGIVDSGNVLREWLGARDPVVVLVAATALILAGGLVIVFPALLAWGVGLSLLLGGVAALGTLLRAPGGPGQSG